MNLTRDESNEWVITAEAAQIDLVPLRRNRGIGKGRPVTFDILADQIFVGDGIWLSGHVSGSKLGAGGGEASFSGNLIHDKRPLITESELQLSFGKGGDFVNGVGVIGGAETTLTYSAADGQDAGIDAGLRKWWRRAERASALPIPSGPARCS